MVITGNLIQALGSLTVLGDELNDPTAEGRTFQIIGSFLQAIGNSLQAFGTLLFLSTFLTHPDAAVRNDGKSLDTSGSWIQAAGSVLSALGQTQEELSEISSKGEQEFKGFALLNKQHKYN
ncbi:DUF6944 family repetitive protein [Bacillus sp. NRRL B-14911]|uniref:DUF6944 family repetitive protein n=1 Tax=Bacillus sp. NRRL B-14911 TaxID=313627 RepID=UPI003FA475D4